MKKIIPALCLIVALTFAVSASAQQVKYYYYPATNVYYQPQTGQYVYLNNGSWTTVKALPRGMSVRNSRRVVVDSPDNNVWKHNNVHVKKYKNVPKGRAVGHKGTNPNKAKGNAKKKH